MLPILFLAWAWGRRGSCAKMIATHSSNGRMADFFISHKCSLLLGLEQIVQEYQHLCRSAETYARSFTSAYSTSPPQ